MQKHEKFSWHRFVRHYFSFDSLKRYSRFTKKVFYYFIFKITGKRKKSLSDLRYEMWKRKNMPSNEQLANNRLIAAALKFEPFFSIIMPVYKPDLDYFKQAIESVKAQSYTHWELCIADDFSEDKDLEAYINKLIIENESIKVKFRESNGHISECSNTALEMAKGDFICFMDQDDLLTADALFQVANHLNNNRDSEIIYSDEDKINLKGITVSPYFKPDWSPHTLLSRNYIGHFVMIKRSLIDQVGGFRKGFEGSQDFDLLLRTTEIAKSIHHIPMILYHWRMHENSTAFNGNVKDYALESGKKAIEDTLKRRNIEGIVKLQQNAIGHYKIEYALTETPMVSIIIPTKNNAKILSSCLTSIFKETSYPNYEVILLNNNSNEESLFELIEYWEAEESDRFRAVECSYTFNYSKLMNDGVDKAKGEYILLLNNDTEVIQTDWINCLLLNAQLSDVGAVGAKLLYPEDTVQHGGVIIGLGLAAGHAFIRADRDHPGYYHNLTSITNYSAVTGACLMVAKRKYLEVSGFDENLAIEYNDVDFCLKLIKRGYYNLVVPKVELYHYESLTRGHPHANSKTFSVHLKEVEYFKSKWQKFIDNDPFYNPNLTRKSTHFEVDALI